MTKLTRTKVFLLALAATFAGLGAWHLHAPKPALAQTALSVALQSGLYGATTSNAGTMSAADKTKLNGIESGADDYGTIAASSANEATTSARGLMSAADKQTSIIDARWVVTCVLPAYTETGTAGNEVWTANANGALPASCTDGVAAVTGDPGLLAYNDTSRPDAGPISFTQGTAGTPWAMARTPGLNTAARMQGSTVRVREGFESGLWVSRNPTIGAVGTDDLLWRQPGPPNIRHGIYADGGFSENSALIAGANLATQYRGWLATAGGAASSVTNNALGQGVLHAGTATNGNALVTGYPINPALARYEVEYGVRWSVPAVSDGTGTFTVQLGLILDVNNFSKITLTPAAAANIDHFTTVAGVAGATRALCVACFAINTTYRYVLRKAFGATVYGIWFDPGTGTLAYIADTPAISTSLQFSAGLTKTAGAGDKTLILDEEWLSVYDPKT